MADTNWIKLNRKIWDNFIWDFDKPRYALAWVDMLLMANYTDKKILFDGQIITVKRGSFITSMVKLSERWRMNRRTVKSFLDALQADGMITYTSTKRCTTVFIVNYLTYQGFADLEDTSSAQLNEQPNAQHLPNSVHNSCTTDCTQHKKVKNLKEDSKNVKEDNAPAEPADKPPGPNGKKPVRHKYGEYKNVLLSDEDLAKLKTEFPDWKERIERLSSYIAQSGKSYKNHLATIRNWAKRDKEREQERRGNQGGHYDDNDLDFIPN